MTKMVNKVLLVDDDPTMNYVNEFLIRHYKFCGNVCVEPYPEDALLNLRKWAEEAHQEIPELILLDLNMPVIDGYEFLRTLEIMPAIIKEKVSVYVLSSSNSPGDMQRALTSPFVKGYLIKPLQLKDLQNLFSSF